jgi:hypothetical protein
MLFPTPQSQSPDNKWCRQLDTFAKTHQQELAALSWGLWLENGDSKGVIGIDLHPKPHFVYCPKQAVEQLNNRLENTLQEILGIVYNHNPQVEVLMIAIGTDQIKLIYFEPQPAPPACFQQVGQDVDTLLQDLEQRLVQIVTTAP